MAKFKVGDKVQRKYGRDYTIYRVESILSNYNDDIPCVKLSPKPTGSHSEYMRPDDLVIANASFKIGDKVRHIDDGKDRQVGTVKGIYGDGKIRVKFPNLERGGFDGFNEEELVMANSVCNSKFKSGDKVKVISKECSTLGKTGTVISYSEKDGYSISFPSVGLAKGYDDADLKIVNSVCNAKFEVGKVYRAPWDKDWLCKVLSRTDSSVKCAIKSVRDKSWGPKDEIVTLRIQPKQTEENGSEVIKGQDWEFWADVTNSEVVENSDVKDSKGTILKDGDYAIVTAGELKGKRVKIISIHSRANIYITEPSGSVRIIDGEYLVKNSVVANAMEWKSAQNMSADQKSIQLIMSRSEPVAQYTKVEPGKLYFRRLGAIYMCDDNDLNRKALEVQGMRILPYKVGGVVGNAEDSEIAPNSFYDTFDRMGYSQKRMQDFMSKSGTKKAETTSTTSSRKSDGKPFDSLLKKYGVRNSVVSNALAWKRGVSTNSLKDSVPVKFRPHCTSAYKDGDGVWFEFDEKVGNSLEGSTEYATVSGDSLSDCKSQFKFLTLNSTTAAICNYSEYTKGRWIHDSRDGKNYIVQSNGLMLPRGSGCEIKDAKSGQLKKVTDTELAYYYHLGDAESCSKCQKFFTNTEQIVENADKNKPCDDSTKCQFVGGKYNGKVMTVGEVKRSMRVTGTNKPNGFQYEIFTGAPKVDGYVGPMWGGDSTPLRYESPEAYRALSNSTAINSSFLIWPSSSVSVEDVFKDLDASPGFIKNEVVKALEKHGYTVEGTHIGIAMGSLVNLYKGNSKVSRIPASILANETCYFDNLACFPDSSSLKILKQVLPSEIYSKLSKKEIEWSRMTNDWEDVKK